MPYTTHHTLYTIEATALYMIVPWFRLTTQSLRQIRSHYADKYSQSSVFIAALATSMKQRDLSNIWSSDSEPHFGLFFLEIIEKFDQNHFLSPLTRECKHPHRNKMKPTSPNCKKEILEKIKWNHPPAAAATSVRNPGEKHSVVRQF